MIYIIKLSRPLAGRASFYIGYCGDTKGALQRRVAEHRAGTGAKMLAAAVRENIAFDVIVTLPGDRKTERKLKRQKNARRIVERILKAGNGQDST